MPTRFVRVVWLFMFMTKVMSVLACVQTQLVSFQRGFSSSSVCESATQGESADISIGIFDFTGL